MFYYIEGNIVMLEPSAAAIETGGVAYRMTVSYNTFSFLAGKSRARLYTYLSVREDGVELFGFRDEVEMNTYKMLTGVSGVGPKAAISLLSTMTPDRLAAAVASGDTKSISKAPGLGAKTAARIVLELKDKLSYSTGGTDDGEISVSGGGSYEDALNALTVLGYSRSDASKALRSIDTAVMDVEEMIKQALKKLTR